MSMRYEESPREEEILSHLLRKGPEIKSRFEAMFRDALIKTNIPTLYEIISFPVEIKEDSTKRFYLPDFLTSIFIDGKEVVIETHAFIFLERNAKRYLKKLDSFRKAYNFYIVLVSDAPTEELEGLLNEKAISFVDEFWYIDYSKAEYKRQLRQTVEMLEKLKGRGEVKTEKEMLNIVYPKLAEIERKSRDLSDTFRKGLGPHGTL